jgi:cytochrome c-type protein NapC
MDIASAVIHAAPGRRAVATHSKAFTEGETCIDCHKGIAHQLPPIEQEIGAPKPVAAATKQ